MDSAILSEVQQLQFSNVGRANEFLLGFFRERLEGGVKSVKLRPLAVSLNSINGIVETEAGESLFFKAHVESDASGREYYNSDLLEKAGYPILRPKAQTEGGLTEHVLLYPRVELPTLFDAMRASELSGDPEAIARLDRTHDNIHKQLFTIYGRSLAAIDSTQSEGSPINQLFLDRLIGGRREAFYTGASISLPELSLTFEEMLGLQWSINGVLYERCLGKILTDLTTSLAPEACSGPAIVGHGDAHNGNVFYEECETRGIYFDPAFAGLHSPFLDLAKPLYHNTFGQWLYFSEEVAFHMKLTVRRAGNIIYFDHDYWPDKLRIDAHQSRVSLVLAPLLQLLSGRQQFSQNWLSILRSALACCPFLTMNLANKTRFPDSIRALGFAHVIQFAHLGRVSNCPIASLYGNLLP